ncbi:MAG: DUF6026 family protein [Pseudomonas sp.]|uniref:DUF6026 family protein n=1 Tax=Pseudomonas abieticivorans TaxID=2931382 RepID=UPI0020C07797|nr:DUF6026 family protein [Pseudomonas sp. PIA16]MDE1165410.1 DUF6026 family protein [Pseudomonas sp.]
MGTLLPATPSQTLYVTIRRDELRDLKAERDALQEKLTQMTALLMQVQPPVHSQARIA